MHIIPSFYTYKNYVGWVRPTPPRIVFISIEV